MNAILASAAFLSLLYISIFDSSGCGPRNDVSMSLWAKYKETRITYGLSHTGKMLEIYSSPDGDTWTIVTTDVKGKTCYVASGTALEMTFTRRVGLQKDSFNFPLDWTIKSLYN